MCAALVAYLSSFVLSIPLSLPKEIQSLLACGSISSKSTHRIRGVPVRWSAWGTKPFGVKGLPTMCADFSAHLISSFVSADIEYLSESKNIELFGRCVPFVHCTRECTSFHAKKKFYFFTFTSAILVLQGLPLHDLPYLLQCRIPLLTYLHKKYVMHKCIKYKQMKRRDRNYICSKHVYMFFYPRAKIYSFTHLLNSYHELEQRIKWKLLIVTMDRTCKTFQCWLHWSDRSSTT